MKFSTLCAISLLTAVLSIAQTNLAAVMAGPNTTVIEQLTLSADLPNQFAGITKTSDYQDFIPVAIYRVRSNAFANFACMGLIYQSGERSHDVVIPEHLFIPRPELGPETVYGIRRARPDKHLIFEYIGGILETSKACSDIVIASVTNRMVPIKPFSGIEEEEAIGFSASEAVFIDKLKTTSIRSHVTGRPMTILGYGLRLRSKDIEDSKQAAASGRMMISSDVHPFIAIDMESTQGCSCHSFKDEHGRFFFLHSGLENNGFGRGQLAEVNRYSMRKYGRKVSGVAMLTGPIVFKEQ